MPVENKTAEDVFAIMGTICWTIQLLPQIWKSWRTKSTQGLSEWLMLIWGISSAFFGVYSVVEGLSIPLILQQQFFGALSLISWAQCQFYGRKRPAWVAWAMYFAAVALFAGFEVGMIYAIRPSYRQGNIRATQFFGTFTIVLTNLALIPQYYEIWKYKEVKGISLVFMSVDMAGGIFNDLSLIFKKFDIVAGVSYSLVVFCDGLIILLALFLNPRAKRRREREAADLERNTGIIDRAAATTVNTPETQSLKEKDPAKDKTAPVFTVDASGAQATVGEKSMPQPHADGVHEMSDVADSEQDPATQKTTVPLNMAGAQVKIESKPQPHAGGVHETNDSAAETLSLRERDSAAQKHIIQEKTGLSSNQSSSEKLISV